MKRMLITILPVVLVPLWACQTSPAPAPREMSPQAALEARGRAVAEQRCASCHSIEPSVSSPMREAPEFSGLHTQFPVDQLGERIRGGLMVDHPQMPLLVALSPEEEQALEAFLASIQR